MKCAACRRQPATIELLCDDCLEQLACPFRLAPDRVRTIALAPSPTALIDPWGRAHPVELATLIGRHLDGAAGIQIGEASVSRHHANLSRDPVRGWLLRDLGSSNGTFVGEARVELEAVPVAPGARLRFAQVGFWFVELPVRVAGPPTPRTGPRARSIPETLTEEGDNDDAFGEIASGANTRIGLPSIAMSLFQPAPGGAGLIEVAGKQAQLSNPQFQLLAFLCVRAQEEEGAPEDARGFVAANELLRRLPWDSPRATEDHVKQLVHRTRRVLERAGIGDLIESRQGSGYRLRVMPEKLRGPEPEPQQ